MKAEPERAAETFQSGSQSLVWVFFLHKPGFKLLYHKNLTIQVLGQTAVAEVRQTLPKLNAVFNYVMQKNYIRSINNATKSETKLTGFFSVAAINVKIHTLDRIPITFQ